VLYFHIRQSYIKPNCFVLLALFLDPRSKAFAFFLVSLPIFFGESHEDYRRKTWAGAKGEAGFLWKTRLSARSARICNKKTPDEMPGACLF